MRVLFFVLFTFLAQSVGAQWNKDAQPFKEKMRYNKAISQFEKNTTQLSEIKDLEYARTLFAMGNFQKAFNEYQKFHRLMELQAPRDIYNFITSTAVVAPELHDSIVDFYLNQQIENGILGYKDEILVALDSVRYNAACFNSKEFEDFSPTIMGNTLLFVSSRTNPLSRTEQYDYNRQPFYNVYSVNGCDVKDIDEWKSDEKPRGINSDLHDGPIFLSAEKGLVFITRNISKKTNVFHLGIFWSQRVNGKWSALKPMEINGSTYSVQHPYFNNETNELYFSSNMAGPSRGFDIYKIKFDNGHWSSAEALPGTVNTPLDEVFPYIYKNKLYFSSNGFAGIGGLDVFSVQQDSIITREDAFNTIFDDYGVLWLSDSTGLFSSNRDGGFGKDDIYQFTLVKDAKRTPRLLTQTKKNKLDENEFIAKNSPEAGKKPVVITLFDSLTKQPLADANVYVALDPNLGREQMYKTDNSGRILVPIEPSTQRLSINAKPCGYSYQGKVFILDSSKSKESYKLTYIPFKLGDNLTKIFNLDNIYYERNSFQLTDASKLELNKVVEVLNNNPGLTIELGSHTDSRASAQYNQTLSQNRAKAAFNYMVLAGISPARITYRGYGETKLLNRCADNVVCAEEEHLVNRRTEFIITSLPSCDSASKAQLASNSFNRNTSFATANGSIGQTSNNKAYASNSSKDKAFSSANGMGVNSNKAGRTSSVIKTKENQLKTLDYRCGDADGDGILDYLDPDSDNDGILDRLEGSGDMDHDGNPNYRDVDSDGDGLSDEFEGIDDTDKDGRADFVDTDSDNDGIEDQVEGVIDLDKDGKENYIDTDSDGDGISDKVEGTSDSDGDGISNYLDDDSDGDGISDRIETALDFDRDGKPNYLDLDSDADGMPDSIEKGENGDSKPIDSDKDGKPNFIDLDSDNDGISDKDESPSCLTNNSGAVSTTVENRQTGMTLSGGKSKTDQTEVTATPYGQMMEYRVQIYTSATKLSSNFFQNRGLNSAFEYFHGGSYKYCSVKSFKTESEALTESIVLKQQGFSDAFVVVFKNGIRVR